MNSPPDPAKSLGLQVRLAETDMLVFTEDGLNKVISQQLRSESSHQLYCAHHNMHSLAVANSKTEMFFYHQCAKVHWIDGMPLILMLRLLGYKLDRSWRVTFLDWQHSFFAMCVERSYKVFLLGAKPTTIKLAADSIRSKNPKLDFDFHHGYLSNKDASNSTAIQRINDFRPDILIVGMGMPMQEHWILKNGSQTNARVIMPIGGFFDYLAGQTYTPPRWTGKLGLEWLARLISSPRRLGYRYLIEPWPVGIRFIREWFERANF